MTLPYCSAISMKYIWPSGLRCRAPDGFELVTGQSVIHRPAAAALGVV